MVAFEQFSLISIYLNLLSDVSVMPRIHQIVVFHVKGFPRRQNNAEGGRFGGIYRRSGDVIWRVATS